MADMRPFRIEIPEADLDDLRARLDRACWADDLPGAHWEYGVPAAHVRELAGYWRDGFDWRRQEARLNAYPQFTTTVDGQKVHFLHVRSPESDALPLILTHGWPGSVAEFLDVIGPLTDPRAHGADPADIAFHLVIPSLPGFGFSGPTTERGWTPRRIGAAWAEVMARLGYRRYGAAGNDWGSYVAPEVGRAAPAHVIGVHVTQLFSLPAGQPGELDDLSAEEQAALRSLQWAVLQRPRDLRRHCGEPERVGTCLNHSGPRRLGGLEDEAFAGQQAGFGQIAEGIWFTPDSDGNPGIAQLPQAGERCAARQLRSRQVNEHTGLWRQDFQGQRDLADGKRIDLAFGSQAALFGEQAVPGLRAIRRGERMQRGQVAKPVHVDLFPVKRAQGGRRVLRHEPVGDNLPPEPRRQPRLISDERRIVGSDPDSAVTLCQGIDENSRERGKQGGRVDDPGGPVNLRDARHLNAVRPDGGAKPGHYRRVGVGGYVHEPLAALRALGQERRGQRVKPGRTIKDPPNMVMGSHCYAFETLAIITHKLIPSPSSQDSVQISISLRDRSPE